MTDVAREAGVSSATVDRVLNRRHGVKPRTREIVMETAQRLGYIARDSEQAPGPLEKVRLDFVLPAGTNPFIIDLHTQIERQALLSPEIDARIRLVEGFNPVSLAEALHELKGETMGVGVVTLDHPTVREAIRDLAAADVKVATLVSDISQVPRVGYVGIDNRAAGRLAGYLVGRFLPRDRTQEVALLAGSLSYRGHEEREMGFRHIVAEAFENLEVVQLREVEDDRERAYVEALSLLKAHPRLAAIYNIGGGNRGILRALKEMGRAQSVVFVGHELNEHTKTALLDGTMDAVIDQNPRVEAREVLALLNCAVRYRQFVPQLPRLQAIFRENIPEV